MSALDKLNAKANIDTNKEETKSPVKTIAVQKQPTKNSNATASKKKTTPAKNKNVKTEAKKTSPEEAKQKVGRKNTRGEKGEDYKMMNIAVPMDVYEKLKEASNGNMTYHINALLRDSVGM